MISFIVREHWNCVHMFFKFKNVLVEACLIYSNRFKILSSDFTYSIVECFLSTLFWILIHTPTVQTKSCHNWILLSTFTVTRPVLLRATLKIILHILVVWSAVVSQNVCSHISFHFICLNEHFLFWTFILFGSLLSFHLGVVYLNVIQHFLWTMFVHVKAHVHFCKIQLRVIITLITFQKSLSTISDLQIPYSKRRVVCSTYGKSKKKIS